MCVLGYAGLSVKTDVVLCRQSRMRELYPDLLLSECVKFIDSNSMEIRFLCSFRRGEFGVEFC